MLISKLVIINREDIKSILEELKYSYDNRLIVKNSKQALINLQYNDEFFEASSLFQPITKEDALKFCLDNGLEAKLVNNELFYKMKRTYRVGSKLKDYKERRKSIRESE
jgi:hypothetical protein